MHPLVTPDLGQIVWSTIVFILLMILLRVFAWPTILGSIKSRNLSIKEALESANSARLEIASLQADNEKILMEARKDRDKLIAEAKEMKDQIIKEAKTEAEAEANKLIEKARKGIISEKTAAINDIKIQIADLSVSIAEKLLKQKLSGEKDQKDLIENIMKDITLN